MSSVPFTRNGLDTKASLEYSISRKQQINKYKNNVRKWIAGELVGNWRMHLPRARAHEIEINNFQFDFAHYDGVGDEYLKNAIPVRSMFHFVFAESAKEREREMERKADGERER